MTILHSPDPATVWIESARPARLVWRGRRWVVTDTPTHLADEFAGTLVTHLPDIVGWRFQGTNDDGESRVFDVVATTWQDWRVVAVYE